MKDLEDLYGQTTERILVTCALPYVNNVPHLGNMVPILSADVYSRYLSLKEIPSIYICATDEHGTRTEMEASKKGVGEEEYCADLHRKMLEIFQWFHVDFDHFGRTSCEQNHQLTQSIFGALDKNGYVLDEENEQLYDPEAEMYLPDTYVTGTCPYCSNSEAQGDQCDICGRLLDPLELISPKSKVSGATPEKRSTRHLFLRLDLLSPKIKAWLEDQGHWEGIIKNQPLGWIAEGMRPRAITRDLKWGVKVPREGFQDKVFYVWFDAPIGYIAATAEWAEKEGVVLEDWWKSEKSRVIHFLGKDNVPFHTIMWPATLIGSEQGWSLPYYIAANEYLNYEGGAFSKSRDRGIFSDEVTQMGFPADMVRFYLMANRPEKRDSDFNFESFQNLVNAGLVGNYGNLANRLLSFIAKRFGEIPAPGALSSRDQELLSAADRKVEEIDRAYRRFELRKAVRHLLELSDLGNGFLQSSEPWRTFKEAPEVCQTTLYVGCQMLYKLARWSWPVMPERAERLMEMLGTDLDSGVKAGTPISRPEVLFSPIEEERVIQLVEAHKGKTEETSQPLVFEKEKGVTWPCVILEFTGLSIKRRVKSLEKWKQEVLQGFDVSALSGERIEAYYHNLEERDQGDRLVSVANLMKIYQREGRLPNINTLVDIYNMYSLQRGIVMGAYERNTIQGKLVYAVAHGKERFVPVKGRKAEKIFPGEWILKDETDMVVTKVTTKQSEAAAITPQTTSCVICLQGNGLIGLDELLPVADELIAKIQEYCGGEARVVFSG